MDRDRDNAVCQDVAVLRMIRCVDRESHMYEHAVEARTPGLRREVASTMRQTLRQVDERGSTHKSMGVIC